MRELLAVWKNTRLVVQVALTAGLYTAILIPFKPIPLVPGITEVRPANAIPIVCALLFGPAAAWGAAFGNLIGDFQRILYFSGYAGVLADDARSVKDLVDPFTGCFISMIPSTVSERTFSISLSVMVLTTGFCVYYLFLEE